jgi:hypothetical protein
MQLPLSFDAAALEAEVGAVEESAWRPHPQGYAGNDALNPGYHGRRSDSDAVAGTDASNPATWSVVRTCGRSSTASAQPGVARA